MIALALALHLAGPVQLPPEAAIEAARGAGWAHQWCYVVDHPGDWYRVALAHDSTVTWPARTTLVGVTDKGATIVAAEAFVVGAEPRGDLWRIGGAPFLIDPDETWRVSFHGRPGYTAILVRFVIPAGSARVVAIRPERLGGAP